MFLLTLDQMCFPYPRILPTKVALFRFQTPSSGPCDGMRDGSKWAAAGNGNADPEGWLSPL